MSKSVLFSLMILVLVALGLSYLAVFYFDPHDGALSRADYGALGDYFGGLLNPTFALLSFLALLGTITLQVRELGYQRKEMKRTRKEMRASKKAQQKSAKELTLQNQLQIHAVRAGGLSTLIETASLEARHAESDDLKGDALKEVQLYARQLEAELEAVSDLVPEATERVRTAEENLFGYSTQ